ncbi:unnamed protein product [Cochlearia groenlandica]
MEPEDIFCKKCSCFICHKFDDDQDPNLWLTCNSGGLFADEYRGFSCHLDCAFESEKPKNNDVDGCFYSVSCDKTITLLKCLKRQMMIAKRTTSVDVLCCRLLLTQKLLKGTKKYIEVSQTVDEAIKSLEAEFGSDSLAQVPSSKRRGNVRKLRSCEEVKNLCCSALTLLDELILPSNMQGSTKIEFEDVLATSLTLILGSEESTSPGNIIHYTIWHRKTTEKEYPKESTCELFTLNTRFDVSGLTPSTEYCFKVVSFSGVKERSVDEFKVTTQISREDTDQGHSVSLMTDRPEKPVNIMEKQANGGLGFEQCLNILRKLESLGLVEKNFRVKFFTWFSKGATADEVKILETFIDAFKDDFEDLAAQLVDAFSDSISKKSSAFGGGGSG